MIQSLAQLDPNGSYSYEDYLDWQFNERVELLRGRLREMSAPSRKHQTISMKLTRPLVNALWDGPCKVFAALFDIYQEAGVLEYWIVLPNEKTVQVWKLTDEGYYIGLPPKVEDDILTTPIIPNLEIDLTDVFAD